MTKDVLLSISGLHQDVTGIEAQAMSREVNQSR